MHEATEWIIGFVLVLIYAQSRFNTPKSNKSSTTVYRYHFAFICYFLSLCLLYLLLGGGISASPALYDQLIKGADDVAGEGQHLSGGPLLSALFLTTLLPNFPVLSKIDKWLRGTFQEIGRIPREARELCGNMRRSTFIVPGHRKDTLRRFLADFPDADIRFHPDSSPQFEWTQITSLYLEVRSWSDKRKYSGFIETFQAEYRQLETGYEKLRAKAMKCMRWMSDYNDTEGVHPINECKKDFQEQMSTLKKELCNFIARSVLSCELTGRERRVKLEEMGFSDMVDNRSPLTAHQAVSIGFIVFLFMFFGNLFFRGTSVMISRTILTSMMVATIYGFSILLTIYLKVVWPFADIRRVGQRPVAAYLVSGLLAVVLAFLISLTFKFVWFWDFIAALNDIKAIYPWFLMSFTITVTLSYLADDGVLSAKPLPSWMRWVESITCSLVLMAAAWVVVLWLSQVPDLSAERLPQLKVVALISGGIGLAIGYIVPNWYRSLPTDNCDASAALDPVILKAHGGVGVNSGTRCQRLSSAA